MKVLNRGNLITDEKHALARGKLASTMKVRQTPIPLDKNQYASANASSVVSINGDWTNNPIHCMVSTMLEENQDMKPEVSIVVKMKLNIPLPEEYSGSSELEVYETFIAGILQWLRLNGLLGEDHTEFQVEYLGIRLEGDALEWYTRNVKRHD